MRPGLIILIVISIINGGCGEQSDIKVYNVKSSEFLKFATHNATFETLSSQLVADKGSNEEVKSFAQMLTSEKSAMLDELRSFAEANLFILPNSILTEHQVKYSTLSQLKGISLDRKFADEMVLLHAEDLAKFDSAAQYADIKEIRLWAEKYLPIIKSYSKEAGRLDKLTDNL
jgi:putative membrane protein